MRPGDAQEFHDKRVRARVYGGAPRASDTTARIRASTVTERHDAPRLDGLEPDQGTMDTPASREPMASPVSGSAGDRYVQTSGFLGLPLPG